MSAWDLRPEPKFELARESVRGVVSRLRAILANDAPGVCESLAPDEVEMLMLQLKLGAGHLGAAAVALREVEQERRLLVRHREQDEMRFERETGSDRSDLNDLNDGELRTEN